MGIYSTGDLDREAGCFLRRERKQEILNFYTETPAMWHNFLLTMTLKPTKICQFLNHF